jgi:hypothetical protein
VAQAGSAPASKYEDPSSNPSVIPPKKQIQLNTSSIKHNLIKLKFTNICVNVYYMIHLTPLYTLAFLPQDFQLFSPHYAHLPICTLSRNQSI